ncbi:RTA1-domain-containing protein [Dothidotthia symphoricarpi CBS 119687]|uniref:RTA1-domain-containing protein n=1 Tax=Dothidotthia symphoricarpi CBS 119687 TaxID=1392245 RepID=A0A6A5ZYR5_9PLEO|nr:RTA1-domain-containing protein [Dothidotthia symphoricarpi CBS 119687]KAF2123538.1 RTA1-domain-containing protein [Dothidotthia symphoricarpi CBS 119687]
MPVPPSAGESCLKVGPGCPVEGTLYGYYPSLPANAFFAAVFALCFILQLIFGIKYKTWTYMIALGLGCVSEAAGYGGRIMMHANPFDDNGFQLQICLLIISPAFISAGIYITLKHIVLNFGEDWSRLRSNYYTYIFITGDFISLCLQGAGGGLAATADNGSKLQDTGTSLMISGVVFQVVMLACFGYLLVEYTLRTHRRRNQLSAHSMMLFHTTSFRCFIAAIVIAYFGILIRCIYRIPELAMGWRSELMRNETDFIVLEGVMIVISAVVLTVFHPGFCFPALANTIGKKNKTSREKSTDESLNTERMTDATV